MQRFQGSNISQPYGGTRSATLGDLLTARPTGLIEPETWAVLCQSVQALQDLFLSDGVNNDASLPLVTPNSLILSAKGRVELQQNTSHGFIPPPHLSGYLAPEYRPNKHWTDTETEKMWIYGLGETMKRASLTSHAATSRLSIELCRVLTDMTRFPASSRASLMNLLDVISEYCKQRQQSRPFSHIVMDLHQEAMAAIELALETPWGPPAMPELRTRTSHRSDSNNTEATGTIPRKWPGFARSRTTKEASTSMEDVTYMPDPGVPGSVCRPKSMSVPHTSFYSSENIYDELPNENYRYSDRRKGLSDDHGEYEVARTVKKCSCERICDSSCVRKLRRGRRNPVQRAASRLYSAGKTESRCGSAGDCIGPEFVVRASLPNKKLAISDQKNSNRKNILVILLNGQKLDVSCNPNTTTAGQLFELIIQKEHIEENFMLGMSALIAGDFVFLPSDTRICKAMQPTGSVGDALGTLTLFMRVRFFLPSLRGIRSPQARHLLYLQLRRSILEHQLPCSFSQLIEMNGFAMQAEFGDYRVKEHGTSDYFLLEHYVPDTMACAIDDHKYLREELVKAHKSKCGMNREKAEEDFISCAQKLSHYGGHFYTATWTLKDNTAKDVWLYISAQGINLYKRGQTTSNCGPELYEMFDWKNIQTLCYSKRYLCVIPKENKFVSSKLKKYKLKMDNKKSYFTFRLASLHHQFFLRLRTEYASLQSLSQQFGIPLKDMKNETNSLYKLEALTEFKDLDLGTVNADTEFRIEFRPSSRNSDLSENYRYRRSKSADDFPNGDDKEKWNSRYMVEKKMEESLSSHDNHYVSGPQMADKRRGVKMGTRAIVGTGCRISRSMEAVNARDDLESLSLQSVSLHCSSNSIRLSRSELLSPNSNAYILDSTIKACSNILPDFHESLSESLLDKFNNISFAEERMFSTVTVEKDSSGSLGIQITQGSDGNVYIQTVIPGGAAYSTGKMMTGDQIVAVDHQNLLGIKYEDALNMLKSTGHKVDFMLSRIVQGGRNISHTTSRSVNSKNMSARINLTNINDSNLTTLRIENTMNKLKMLSSAPTSPRKHFIINEETSEEKHITESCMDLSNTRKYGRNLKIDVPYHKHIRYEIEPENMSDKENSELKKNISMSCNRLNVGQECMNPNYHSLDRKLLKDLKEENLCKEAIPPIPLPRSLGLGRKWRGPVRYPVTPVKKLENDKNIGYDANTTSDEEQVFI